MSNNNWIEKYNPKTISELESNKKAINSIQTWLTYFDTIKGQKAAEKLVKPTKTRTRRKKK